MSAANYPPEGFDQLVTASTAPSVEPYKNTANNPPPGFDKLVLNTKDLKGSVNIDDRRDITPQPVPGQAIWQEMQEEVPIPIPKPKPARSKKK